MKLLEGRRREQRKPSGLSQRGEEGCREAGVTDAERANSRREDRFRERMVSTALRCCGG